MANAETPVQSLRLPLDTAVERDQAALRVLAALVAVGAGMWLAWVEGPLWLRLTGVVSVMFAALFIKKARTSRAISVDPAAHYLEITAENFTISDGVTQRSVPRAEIRTVELDEDRLVVVLRLSGGEELPIEPRYGGLPLRELGETLQRALWAPAHRDALG